MAKLFGGGKKSAPAPVAAPPPPPTVVRSAPKPAPEPDGDAIRRAKLRDRVKQRGRRGRASTILTGAGTGGTYSERIG